jgi:hypothetical protein
MLHEEATQVTTTLETGEPQGQSKSYEEEKNL